MRALKNFFFKDNQILLFARFYELTKEQKAKYQLRKYLYYYYQDNQGKSNFNQAAWVINNRGNLLQSLP